MARDIKPPHSALAPPQLARALIVIMASAPERAALIGDMEEEFAQQSQRSPHRARAWYWRQTAISAPYLALKRLRSEQTRRLGVALGATLGAFLLIHYWDIFIARGAARGFAVATGAQTFFLTRSVYLLVQMTGVSVAGGAIAALTFREQDSFARNTFRRLIPAGAIILSPTLFAMIAPADHYDLSFRLLQLALAVPALFIGARIAMWLRGRYR
ncbi:MAG: hypothetical protein GXP06_07835 [Alphaproteobacteria bacterium]|nr:hypothetical protein [Alphaproteobacteria bacterium]